MSLRRRQLLGWTLLAAAAIAGGAWLLRLDFGRKISTDVLDLIPQSELAPEVALLRELASEAEARTMLFALANGDGPASDAAAGAFAGALRASGAFESAEPADTAAARESLGRELFNLRFTLLFPIWLRDQEAARAGEAAAAPLAPWLAGRAAASLSRFLSAPEALAFQDLIPADPLLLLPSAVTRLTARLPLVQPQANASRRTLLWARLSASPLSEAGQLPAFAAIDAATGAARAIDPGFTAAYTGVNRFAAASRARLEKEFSWLNLVSLGAVLAVAIVFIRSAWRSLHLVPVMGLSLLGAWAVATMAFPRVHILVFAIGSLLSGVAVDYGFYLYMQPAARIGEDYWEKVRRLRKPLLASCLTTVGGFALLLFSELPVIRQLGVFVGAGLLCALAAAVVYFATVRNPYLEARPLHPRFSLSAASRRRVRLALIALWVCCLPGLARLSWRDDVREMDIPSPELRANDAQVRGHFGEAQNRAAYLSFGASIAEARDSLQAFESWLSAQGLSDSSASLGLVIPTVAEHARALRFFQENPDFPGRLREALGRAGLEVDAFAPFFEGYARQPAEASAAALPAAVESLSRKMVGPMGMLVHPSATLSWFVTIVAAPPPAPPPAETRTVSAGQLQSLNQMFGRYRRSAVQLSLVGLAMVGAGVLYSYGLKDGIRIFAIPCGACLGLFGALGWLGQPLNLFHLLGAFLGVCLTHNYSIFSVTSAYRREPPPQSVRVSALTAAASFGVLALSSIPVVRALGTTVALMVLVALIVIEFEHFAPIARKT